MPPLLGRRVSAVELSVRDEGEGPTVVLLHGIGADRTVWNAVIPALAHGERVLAPDLRGHGRTPAPPGARFTLEEHVTDLLGMLDQRNLPAVHWVGLSGGALLALRLGLDVPDRCRSLTLVGGAVYTDAHTRSIAERWAETYSQEGADALAIRLLKDLYYPDWIEGHMEFADRLREEVPKRDYRPAALWAQSVATFDERSRVASLRPPALIIQAMDDQVVDASHGRILRQSIPGSRIRIFAHTGHMIPIERPVETAEAIRTFVAEVEEGRSPSSAAGLSQGADMDRT